MRLNIFEGSRRICAIVYVLTVVAGVAGVYGTEPYLFEYYRVSSLFGIPVRTTACSDGEGIQQAYARTPEGHSLSATLCFATAKADDGRMLIPYAMAGEDNVWMAGPGSEKVRAYMAQYAASFKPWDGQALDQEWDSENIKKKGRVAGGTVAALVIWWLLFKLIGWICRGFMGIPSGKDFRDQATT